MSFLRSARVLAVLLAAGAALGATTAYGQSPVQTARSIVRSPAALAMGDAAAAFPSSQTVFFYNPAHLAHVAPVVPHINILGVSGGLSSTVFDQVRFFRNQLQPALDEGLDNLSDDALLSLYDETTAMGRKRTLINGDVLLPSVMVRVGGVGVGGGLFAHSLTQYHVEGTGVGIPVMNLASQVDLMALGTAGMDFSSLGLRGLSAGLTSKFTRRYVTMKSNAVDALADDDELYLFSGQSVGFDLGLLYEVGFVSLPGRLNVGMAFYDVVATDFHYKFDRSLLHEDRTDPNAIAREQRLIEDQFSVSPSYRVGLAYTVPSLLGVFKQSGIAVDYLSYNRPHIENQPLLAHIHVGAQASLSRILSLRAGLNQGYPTVGAGLSLGFMQLDYAFFGAEHGRLPGQASSWNHSLQMAFGLF